MTKTLPELFAEAMKVCPEIACPMVYDLPGSRSVAKKLHHSPVIGWSFRAAKDSEDTAWISPIHEQHAEHIIVGAAVRMLPEHSWIPYANRFLVTHLQTQTRYEAPTLAAALLLAVLAQAERTKP